MKACHIRRSFVLLLLLLLLLPATAHAATPKQSGPPPTGELDETLANMTYLSDYTESGEIELEDGQFEDADNMIFATLANRPRAYGDINADETLDAVVWLATNTGGSGVFVDLAAVVDVETEPVNVATTLLGDRTQVQSIAIDDDGVITVEVITQGPDDPMCCPTQIMRLQYILDSGVLALISEEIIGVVGDEETDGSVSEPLTGTAEITVTAELTGEVEAAPEDAAPEEEIDVTVDENPFDEGVLENATYLSDFTEAGEVTLIDGVFDDPENRIHVELVAEPRVYGDVDGDGVADALVVLVSNTGGSGVFHDLAVVLNQDGIAFNADSDLLGDRVLIESIDLYQNGLIIVRMLTQAPEDPLCCPTLLVDRVYNFVDDALILLEEIDVVAAEAAAAEALALLSASELETFSPGALPLAATLTISSASPLSPDPALVTVIGGPGDLLAVDATLEGTGCAGWIAPAPDVVLHWDGDADSLRFFTLGGGDPTMLVVAPDGRTLCSDDVQTDVFNPLVIDEEPVAGRYAIFVGVYDPSVTPVTSLLVVTTRDLDPLSYPVSLPVVEEQASSEAETEPDAQVSSGTTILPDDGPQRETLTADDLPATVELVGGGDVAMFEQGLGNTLCTGFASAAPIYRFVWDASAGAVDTLVFFYEAEVDTTLIVRDPTAAYQCVDDSADGNLNPSLALTAIPGDYEVWVGTYIADTEAPGVLTIGSDPSATPAVLVE